MYLEQHNDDLNHGMPHGSAVRRLFTREDAMQKILNDKTFSFRGNGILFAAAHERARRANMTFAEFCRAAVRDAVKDQAA
ncbi:MULTISPECIES: hypothetical protein [unclassified Sphingomonas]|uniref:hypothetical protein n=1 Tax=unclassified Sphingomonas TaxID=196159 RepID=UPI0006FE21B0|nr:MULTISPECIES: hypothetical protein [unclassified Sphingomonas]KQM28757.1 hypothetical protein ASE58_02515 [Sphingomonas sp. Leaf9]KQM45460.1 hypothetical protein ASE57_02510 [Sphingomonas sp. Leaf11]